MLSRIYLLIPAKHTAASQIQITCPFFQLGVYGFEVQYCIVMVETVFIYLFIVVVIIIIMIIISEKLYIYIYIYYMGKDKYVKGLSYGNTSECSLLK